MRKCLRKEGAKDKTEEGKRRGEKMGWKNHKDGKRKVEKERWEKKDKGMMAVEKKIRNRNTQ